MTEHVQHPTEQTSSDAELAARSGIESIPTLVVRRKGQPTAARAGVIGAEALIEAHQCPADAKVSEWVAV